MSVNMRQGISASLSQQLVMSTQLQQSLKLLQCSGVELEAELAQMLNDNPLLELHEANEIDPPESFDSINDNYADTMTDGSSATQHSDNDEHYMPEMAYTASLQEYLLEQLGTSQADEEERTLITYLIGDIDENGYLVSSVEELSALLSGVLDQEIAPQQVEDALSILQSFEPPGIAARSLAECLLLQLDSRRLADAPDKQVLACARQICQYDLEALAKADLERLKVLTQQSTHIIRQAHHLITQLDPRPGKAWSTPTADFAVPDVLVRRQEGEWVLILNPQVLPKLRIVPEYERIVKVLDRQTLRQSPQLQEQLKQARSFMTQLKQRFATILMVAQAIMNHQEDFFAQGLAGLRPLTLKDIANDLGMHESTVSRATVQKFIATPHGVFELKRFFSAALSTQDGEQTSATSTQQLLRELIETENTAKPLSDNKLCELLAQKGIVIARRTVTKYREAMGLPAASQRKAQAILRGED
ncbi:MAG: RNA polymerase factor sigma-54 [Pelistega sp.]|nr:RNA polymerase factor sigma-54 [Pelistega sp.]